MDAIQILIANNDYDQALEVVNAELAGDEYNIDLLVLKAQIYNKLERHSEVIEIYNILINLLPNNAEHHAVRGLSYHALGEHQQTLADLSAAIELEPENGYRYASRAFIKDFLGLHLEALEDYNKALELDPEDAVSLNNRGLVEEKLGRMQLAQESFKRADELAGVEIQDHKPIMQTSNEVKEKSTKVDFKYFIGILKSLFTSASERKKFINFLFKN